MKKMAKRSDDTRKMGYLPNISDKGAKSRGVNAIPILK
jgi:hypothetical protein